MIRFHDPDYLLHVLNFARKYKCANQLIEKLDYLSSYGDGLNTAELHRDFAPFSFEFVMHHADGTPWFHGGLIYSGPGQPLDGGSPAFSVSLANETGHNWSVHT